MAQTYTVCDDDALNLVTINMTEGSELPATHYTDAGGCTVSDITKNLTFTITGGASTSDFQIRYSHDVQFYLNEVLQETQKLFKTTRMSAGQTSKVVNVYVRHIVNCPSEDGTFTQPAFNEEF